ncbi:MAG: DNA-protecting protein DprA [Desulfobacterales bacterium]|jgi:DNA processing protein|nr:DNA-protecting protein DprA [Desulfobacteraceae bacterium]MBT7696079.1 DNA-protecting protein DprA [Desulfobacterales bacterium]
MSEVLSWLTLKSIPGLGNYLIKRLIDRFASPGKIFKAPRDSLLGVEGITPRLVSAIRNHKTSDAVKKDYGLALEKGFQIITLEDSMYPELLRQIPDPPSVLYIYGKIDNSINNIAVVGSRNATGYGISMTQRLCRDLAAYKIKVVSGMAMGIDTAAHKGTLSGNGKTFAVLGSGLGRIYPAENRKLFHSIAENGAVISEFPVMTGPDSHHFPIRNRVISGISLGTVVVEATKRSGSLITARIAGEQNREVFAVPGSIQSFKSTGTHSLLKQGAKLVENAQDIIEELPWALNIEPGNMNESRDKIKTVVSSLDSDELLVYEVLGPYPVHIDVIMRKTSIASGKLAGILLKLELEGLVNQNPGKLFSISEEML